MRSNTLLCRECVISNKSKNKETRSQCPCIVETKMAIGSKTLSMNSKNVRSRPAKTSYVKITASKKLF